MIWLSCNSCPVHYSSVRRSRNQRDARFHTVSDLDCDSFARGLSQSKRQSNPPSHVLFHSIFALFRHVNRGVTSFPPPGTELTRAYFNRRASKPFLFETRSSTKGTKSTSAHFVRRSKSCRKPRTWGERQSGLRRRRAVDYEKLTSCRIE